MLRVLNPRKVGVVIHERVKSEGNGESLQCPVGADRRKDLVRALLIIISSKAKLTNRDYHLRVLHSYLKVKIPCQQQSSPLYEYGILGRLTGKRLSIHKRYLHLHPNPPTSVHKAESRFSIVQKTSRSQCYMSLAVAERPALRILKEPVATDDRTAGSPSRLPRP